LADSANEGFEVDAAGFAFAVDALPLAELFPGGGDAAYFCLAAVGEDDGGVVPEELGDGFFVVGEIFCIGFCNGDGVGFEFDKN